MTIKLVVVGVGKTSLLITYINGLFPMDYIPPVYDACSVNVTVKEQVLGLQLWDSAGSEQHDRLRHLCYPGTDIFLICFAINSQESFDHVRAKWYPEISHHVPQALFILVGTKEDLRRNSSETENVTYEQGVQLAKDLNAIGYLECSSLANKNVKTIFDSAVINISFICSNKV